MKITYQYTQEGESSRPWYWLLLPVVIPAVIIILIIGFIIELIIRSINYLRMLYSEQIIHHRLADQNRYVNWTTLQKKLQQGEGTLIIEHVSPNGPIREWWIPENLITSMSNLPTSVVAAIGSQIGETNPKAIIDDKSISAFVLEFCAKYLDLQKGTALLTRAPDSLVRWLTSSSYRICQIDAGKMILVRHPARCDLQRAFPKGNIVTVVAWLPVPGIALGDVESVFTRH